MRRPGAAVATLALLAACEADGRAISRDDLPSVPDRPDHLVVLDADGFEPDELDVRTTDLVALRVEGESARRIRSGDDVDTGTLDPGETIVLVFEDPGRTELVGSPGRPGHDATLVVRSRRDPG